MSEKITNMTEATSIDGANDYLVMVDVDDTTQSGSGTNKKIKPDNLGISSSPLTTKGDLYGFSTVDARLPVGTNKQILEADSAEALGVKWSDQVSVPLTTKGDLLGFSTVNARLPVGTNDQVLTADSTQSLGVKWADAAGGGAGGGWTVIVKPSDESRVSDATPSIDTHLQAELDANSTYQFIVRAAATTASDPSLKQALSVPSGATAKWAYNITDGGSLNYDESGSRATIISAGSTDFLRIGGFVYTGVSGGTFGFSWSQNVPRVDATTVLAGSVLEIIKAE